VPKVFYDIGANDPFSAEGQQTVYKPLMPDTDFFLFEAMAKHETALIRSNEPYAIAILDERDGVEKTFYESSVYPPGTGDSLHLERTEAYAADVRLSSRHVTRRLDSLVEERGWPLPDFIKLDTQGSELDILRGAPRCLAQARGLQIECNVQKYNDDAPMLPEVLAFGQSAGFRLYDIAQFHFNARRELLQADLIFVRAELFGEG
jgi:FkbM family methyltransferase